MADTHVAATSSNMVQSVAFGSSLASRFCSIGVTFSASIAAGAGVVVELPFALGLSVFGAHDCVQEKRSVANCSGKL